MGAMFRLLQSAAFPLGMVRVPQPESPGGLEGDILPYDYTVYTAVACAESLRFYWTTYENQRIQFVDLSTLRHQTRPVQFELAAGRISGSWSLRLHLRPLPSHLSPRCNSNRQPPLFMRYWMHDPGQFSARLMKKEEFPWLP